MEMERTATEIQDERAALLYGLHVTTSLTLAPVFHIHLVILVGEQCYVARWYSELLMFLLPGMRLMPSHTYLANQLTVK